MKTKLTAWQKFAIKFSGFDPCTASYCEQPVIKKLSGLAAVVAMPCIVAIFSYGVLSYFFKPNIQTALIAGGVAAVLIYILEVSIMRYGKAGEFKIAFLGRILLAVSAGWLAAEILVVSLASGVIKQQQFNDLAIAKDSVSKMYATPIQVIKDEYKSYQVKADSMLVQYNLEVVGNRSKRGAGKGPIAKDLKNQYDSAIAQLRNVESKSNAGLLVLEQKRDSVLFSVEAVQQTDFISRLELLDKVANKHPKTNFILWIFRIFLLTIELFPLLMKLSIGKDLRPYYLVQEKMNEDSVEDYKTFSRQQRGIQNYSMEVNLNKRLYQLKTEELKNVSDALSDITKFQMNETIEMAKYKDHQVQSVSGKLDAETYADMVSDLEKNHENNRKGALDALDLVNKMHSSNINSSSI